MKMRILLSVLLALCPLLRASGASSEAARVDALFSRATNRAPGAVVAVVDHGKVVFKKAYGLADVEKNVPLTSRSAFDLASVTKQFTAMGIMILAERGRLHYDDHLGDFFPEFLPFGRDITIRHLLNHTSGLPDYEQLYNHSGLIATNYPRAHREPVDAFEPTSRDALQMIAKPNKLNFKPGEKWEYSDSGYVVLAQIIEKISGKSYAQFLKENIFRPAGMRDTLVYDESRPVIPRRALSYTPDGASFKVIDYTPLNLIYGDGNVNTTLEDMIKWDKALYAGKLVHAATLKEAFMSGTLNDGKKMHYGFGWSTGHKHGFDFVGHGGAWVGFRSHIGRFPERRFSVIILANSSAIKPGDLAEKIEAIYLPPAPQ